MRQLIANAENQLDGSCRAVHVDLERQKMIANHMPLAKRRVRSVMLRTPPKCLAVIAALFLSTPSLSQAFLHGDDLYRFCKMADETPERTTCVAFIIGAVDALTGTHELCLPKDVIGKQVVEIVVNYLLGHPETRQHPATSEIDAALKRYHCNNSN